MSPARILWERLIGLRVQTGDYTISWKLTSEEGLPEVLSHWRMFLCGTLAVVCAACTEEQFEMKICKATTMRASWAPGMSIPLDWTCR